MRRRGVGAEEHDDEEEEDDDGAGVDDELDGSEELRVEREEEAGHAQRISSESPIAPRMGFGMSIRRSAPAMASAAQKPK